MSGDSDGEDYGCTSSSTSTYISIDSDYSADNDCTSESLIELPSYLTAVEDTDSSSVNAMEWWKRHEQDLPNWCSAFQQVLLVQPSSAAAERVFSLLQNSFSQRQSNSLEDYIETSVMLQYNH